MGKCTVTLVIADLITIVVKFHYLADLLMFDCGCNFTWTSPASSTLRSLNPEINPLGYPITTLQESWVAALINLGAAFGPIAFGKFSDIFGRKPLLMMIAALKILSYIILAFAQNIYLFYIARFLMGIGVGLSFAVMPMFTGEIADDHNRGKLASIMGVVTSLGTLYTLVVGPLLPLKIFTLSCSLFLIISLISFFTIVPETPIFLAKKEKKSVAKKSIMKLKNLDPESAETELELLLKSIKQDNSQRSQFIDIFRSTASKKAVIICMSLCSLQHLSGMFPIMAFIEPIFEATGSKIPANLSVILVCLIQLVSTVMSSFAIERLGRKPLLLSSTLGVSISLLSLGFFFYLKEGGYQIIQSIYWLPIISLMVYMVSFSFGLTSVPMAILSEVFPSNIRSTATSFVASFGAFTGFVVTFIFPIVMTFLGGAKCFWLFTGFTILGTIFIYFVVPETKGKSFSEIQSILSKRR